MRSQSFNCELLDYDSLYVNHFVVQPVMLIFICEVNIFSDAIIMCLPITMVARLQMKMKQKLAVAGMFALGTFVIISSSTYR